MSTDTNGNKVLIVDDTPANINVLRDMLEHNGYQIAAAKNGKQALTFAPKFRPNLILLDIMMPEMDGFEACRRLKLDESTKDIPIIFLSAKVEKEDVFQGFELGAVDYILKPFHLEEVLSRIKTHISLRQTILKNEQLIDELKSTVHLLNETQKESSAKSEFIYRMSHELRTPMHAILGFSQLLEQSKSVKEHRNDRESVAEVLKAGKHLLSLINNVLELSQTKSSKNNFEKVFLFEIVENAIAPRYSLADSSKVKIINNLRKENKCSVKGDPKLLHQTVDSLLTNAINYNKEGGAVTFEQSLNEEGTVCLSVINTGENIPEDMLESIFEPFFRLEAHKNLVDGIGMGLTLAKKFIELMGGTISVNNLPDGCCFNLKLNKC